MVELSFTGATEALRIFLSSKGRADLTLKGYLTDLKMFWREMELPETIELEKLEFLASQWLNGRRRVVAPKTTHRRLTTMKNLGLAYRTVILVDYSSPTPPRAKPHPLPGGADDLRSLLNVCLIDEHKFIIGMTGLVGARITEAREVAPEHFDHVNRKVRIWGKGDKVRVVPVSQMAYETLMPSILQATLANGPKAPIVRVGDRAARDLITRLGERAGIARPISSHDLRATFATLSYRKTRDIRAVQELLGHASVKQTELYVDVDEESMRSAANFLE